MSEDKTTLDKITKDKHKEKYKDSQVRRVILIEGTANLVVLIAKVIVGLSTGSLAILADAMHSLTDIANNVVAWLVIRLAAEPADSNHPYGHRKFETLAVFGLASLLVVLAFELGLHAIQKEEAVIVTGAWELGTMIAVLFINIIVASWQRSCAKKLESDILLADASHTFSDVFITLTVIAGWQLSSMGYVWLDTLCTLAVAGVVLYLAYSLFKRAVPVLVDQSAIDPELLLAVVEKVEGVSNVLRIRSRWIGSSKAVDMVIAVDAKLSIAESHEIADAIETLLEEHFHVADISIHLEPE